MNKILYTLLFLGALSACTHQEIRTLNAADTPSKLSHYILALPQISLPIDNQRWTIWHCAGQQSIKTKYLDRNGAQLTIITPHQQFTMQHRPSSNPVIYSDGKIGFYSNGQYAALGTLLDDEVMIGGCTPQSTR